jgi:hypothetical protein
MPFGLHFIEIGFSVPLHSCAKLFVGGAHNTPLNCLPVVRFVQGLLAIVYLYLVDLIRIITPTGDGGDDGYRTFCVFFSAALVGMVFCEFCVNVSAPADLS